MKLDIVTQKENPLLHRRELVLRIEADTTLSRKELREKLALQQNVDADRVSISRITQSTGQHAMTIDARIYESKERLEKTELEHIVFRNRGEKRKPVKKEKKTAKK